MGKTNKQKTMGEMGETSDIDSDETIIDGSVDESDLEEDELHVKR